MVDRCAHHAPRLSFFASYAKAERLMAAGEDQVQCPTCHLFLWPDEVGIEPSEEGMPNEAS